LPLAIITLGGFLIAGVADVSTTKYIYELFLLTLLGSHLDLTILLSRLWREWWATF